MRPKTFLPLSSIFKYDQIQISMDTTMTTFSTLKILTMNWNRLQTVCRIAMQIVLVTTLFSVTFLQLMKYVEENTNISTSYEEDKGDLELPSLTFCPNYKAKDMKQENRTFDEYMKGVLNVTDFFKSAEQKVFLPGKG